MIMTVFRFGLLNKRTSNEYSAVQKYDNLLESHAFLSSQVFSGLFLQER